MITLDLRDPKLIKNAKAHLDVKATEENEDEINFIQPKKTVGKLISVDVLDKISVEIEQLTSRYTISRERGGMGQVEWSDRLIEESEVMQIIDKYRKEQT